MQRTDTLIKMISVLALIALVIYIGYYFYDAQTDPLITTAAMEYTLKDSAPTEGYAIRTEEPLYGGTSRVTVTAAECEKLSVGSTYAMRFVSRDSMEVASEIQVLETRIQWLEALANEGDSAAVRMAKESVSALAFGVNSGNGSSLSQLVSDIRVRVFQSDDFSESSILTQLSSARSRLSTLEAAMDSNVEWLSVDRSGIFSAFTDGLESMTFEHIRDLSPQELSDVFVSSKSADSSILGKLVTDIRWRYAAIMDESSAGKLLVGDMMTLEFSKTYNETLTMEVESIGQPNGGRCVVVFVSDRNLNDIIALRDLTAEAVFSMTTGIRVPKEAVYEDDDQKYIYIVSGIQAQRVDVDVLMEYDGYYLMESGGNLRVGMEIIVEAKDLYSGKVIR